MIRKCRCQHCYGLREYLEGRGLDPRGLPAALGCAYTRRTPDEQPARQCDGSYTCECADCQASRKRLAEHRRKYRGGRA